MAELIINSGITIFGGASYKNDISLNYTNRSLVDKEYVDISILNSIISDSHIRSLFSTTPTPPLDYNSTTGVISVNPNYTIPSNTQINIWNNKQDAITGAASTIVSSNLTSNRALISDSNGKVANSIISTTQLGYLANVTSDIQTQINGKFNIPTGTTLQYVRGDGTLATTPIVPLVTQNLIVFGGASSELTSSVNLQITNDTTNNFYGLNILNATDRRTVIGAYAPSQALHHIYLGGGNFNPHLNAYVRLNGTGMRIGGNLTVNNLPSERLHIDGNALITSLAGTGIRAVTTDSTGRLSTGIYHEHANKLILDQLTQSNLDFIRKGNIYTGHPLSRGIIPNEGEVFIYSSTNDDSFINIALSNLLVSGYTEVDEYALRKSFNDIHKDLKNITNLNLVILPININKPGYIPAIKPDGSIVELPYSRTGVKTLWNIKGELIAYPANVPGVSYDPVTKKLLGHEMQISVVNIFPYSNGSNPNNIITNFSIGTFRTDKGILTTGLISTASNGSIVFETLPKSGSSISYLFSFFFENSDGNNIVSDLNFVFSDGTINAPTITGITIFDCGNNIYRYSCKITFIPNGTSISITTNKTGNRIWKITGFQIVESTADSTINLPYVPTTSTTGIKGADSIVSMNFSTYWPSINERTIIFRRSKQQKIQNTTNVCCNFGYTLSGTYGTVFHYAALTLSANFVWMYGGLPFDIQMSLTYNIGNQYQTVSYANDNVCVFTINNNSGQERAKAALGGNVWEMATPNNSNSLSLGLGENCFSVATEYILYTNEYVSNNNKLSEYSLFRP